MRFNCRYKVNERFVGFHMRMLNGQVFVHLPVSRQKTSANLANELVKGQLEDALVFSLRTEPVFDVLVFKAAEDGGDLVVVIDALGTEVVAASSEEVVEDNWRQLS